MKQLIFPVLFFLTFSAAAQVDTNKVIQKINVNGYAYKNLQADSSISFPQDTFTLKSTWRGIGFKSNVPYYWNGTKWNPFATGTGISQLGTSPFGLTKPNDSTYTVDSTQIWTKYAGEKARDSLAALIALKLTITDTANKWITGIYRKTASDSVFYIKGGTHTFAFKDSIGTGGGSSDTSVLIGDTLYTRVLKRISDDSAWIRSLRLQLNGVTITPTENDSTASWNIVALTAESQGLQNVITVDPDLTANNTLNLTNHSLTLDSVLALYAYTKSGSGRNAILQLTDNGFKAYSTLTGTNKFYTIQTLGLEETVRLESIDEDLIRSSNIDVKIDTIWFRASYGNYFWDSLQHSNSVTDKMLVWDSINNRVATRLIPSGGGGSTDLSIGTRTATDLPLNSSTGADVNLPLATNALAGIISAATKARIDSNQFVKPGEGIDTVWVNDSTLMLKLKYDTVAIASFGAGGGQAGDTVAFSTSTIYGSFFNDGSDTLIITKLKIGLQGTSPSITADVFWNDSLNVSAGATKLVTAGTAATNIYEGTTVTSFNNTKIPPGNWVWVKTSSVTTKPTYFTLTLVGYKKRVNP